MELTFDINRRGDLNKLFDIFNLPMKAAEIGVAEGRFSKEMYKWGLSELYLIDIWEHLPFIDGCASFEQKWHDDNYKSVKDFFGDKENVVIYKGYSHKAVELIKDESLGLIYLDGDHSYHGNKSDLKLWYPKLVSGGILAGHDFANPDYGVNRAVIEFVGGEGNVNVIPEDGSVENIGFWFQKK